MVEMIGLPVRAAACHWPARPLLYTGIPTPHPPTHPPPRPATRTQVKLTMGEYTNIKLTTPEDLTVAEGFLRDRAAGKA